MPEKLPGKIVPTLKIKIKKISRIIVVPASAGGEGPGRKKESCTAAVFVNLNSFDKSDESAVQFVGWPLRCTLTVPWC